MFIYIKFLQTFWVLQGWNRFCLWPDPSIPEAMDLVTWAWSSRIWKGNCGSHMGISGLKKYDSSWSYVCVFCCLILIYIYVCVLFTCICLVLIDIYICFYYFASLICILWHSLTSPNSHFEHMFIPICRDWRICTPEIQIHRSFFCVQMREYLMSRTQEW